MNTAQKAFNDLLNTSVSDIDARFELGNAYAKLTRAKEELKKEKQSHHENATRQMHRANDMEERLDILTEVIKLAHHVVKA